MTEKTKIDKQSKKQKRRGIQNILTGIILMVVSIPAPELLVEVINIPLEQLSTIANGVFILGLGLLIVGIVTLAAGRNKQNEHCPKCGKKVRRTRTFLQRTAGRTGNWYGNADNMRRDTPYTCRYRMTWECKCGWAQEKFVNKSAGKFIEYQNEDYLDQVQEPLPDFDTGFEE